MRAPATWLERIGLLGRVGTLVLFAVVVGRAGWMGLRGLDNAVAALAAEDRVIVVAGGDVALRDVPKAREFRQGRFFSDPYYAGEHHWYPFLTPLVAATVSALGGGPIPESYFRAEAGFVVLYLASLAVLAFTLLRWKGLLLLPFVIWLGTLPSPQGLYPTEAARGGFCLFLALAGLAIDGPLTARRALALGASVGVLGLWSGAPFFVAGAVTAVIAGRAAAQALRQRQPRELVRWLPWLVLAAAVPLALLFGPQVLRHGRLAMPDAARTWMAELYTGGTLGKAVTLTLAPKGLHGILLLVALLRLVGGRWLGRRLGLPCWRRAVPLVMAYFACLLVGHLGFLAADTLHPALAKLARGLLPAPAHTFLSTADACRPAVELLGLAALLELAGLALARLRPPDRLPWAVIVPGLALAAHAVLLFTYFPRIKRFEASESGAVQDFAARVGKLVGTQPVLFRYPGRLVQGTSLKILKLSVPEYANPYDHKRRQRDEQALDAALAAADGRGADAILDRYQIAFVMEDPRAPGDAAIRHCGGEVLAEEAGYKLRRRRPCEK